MRQKLAVKNQTPANDSQATNAPTEAKARRERLELPNFTALLIASEIKISDTADGTPYMALKGCEMTLPGGKVVTRTAMAFDDAFHMISDLIMAHEDVNVTLAYMGSTVKVIGVEIKGEMKMIEQSVPAKAA